MTLVVFLKRLGRIRFSSLIPKLKGFMKSGRSSGVDQAEPVGQDISGGLEEELATRDSHDASERDLQREIRIPEHSSSKPVSATASNIVQLNPDHDRLSYPPMRSSPTENTRLFALIIGINTYVNAAITSLRGAVPDADAVCQFLLTSLGVPESHLRNLRNEDATGDAIKRAIRDFAEDDRIKPGDAILIYYAGHGSEAPSPKGWMQDGSDSDNIQMLLPCDFDPHSSESSTSGQAIYDRTLSKLLQYVAESKGDNIVVIFDSCHSGSGTRDTDANEVLRTQKLPPDYRINPQLDSSLISSLGSGRDATAPYLFSELRSHVLLAACAPEESAGERDGRGYFTSALLRLLADLDFEKTTYADLVLRMPLLPNHPSQTPRCEGIHQTRLLFDSRVQKKAAIHPLKVDGSGPPSIAVGDASGIVRGAEFSLYASEGSAESLGTIIVTSVAPFSAIFGPLPKGIPDPCFVRQTKPGPREPSVNIYLDPGVLSRLSVSIVDGRPTSSALTDINIVSTAPKADLVLTSDGRSVGFIINDKRCAAFGLLETRRRDGSSDEDILLVLRSASHFYFHLLRPIPPSSDFDRLHSEKESSNSKITSQHIVTECTRVQPSLGDDWDLRYVPIGDNLNKNGVIEVEADYIDDQVGQSDPRIYGFHVINKSRHSFYVWIFFFNAKAMSINLWYQPPAAKDRKPCLPPKATIDIGRGAAVDGAYAFTLSKGDTVDVGFFKMFLSTSYVDFSDVAQPSPFGSGSERATSRHPTLPIRVEDFWAGPFIPVVQRPRK